MKNIRVVQILFLFACFSVVSLPLLHGLLIAPSFSKFLRNVAEDELVKVASQLATLIENPHPLSQPAELLPPILEKIDEERKLLGLTKVKVFSNEGLTLYSTDPQDIGKQTVKAFFPALVAGQLPRTDVVMEDKRQPGKDVFLVETYVPVLRHGQVIGIFETYYNMTATKEKLAKVVATITWVVYGSSLFLLVAVLGSAYLTRRSQLLQERAEAEKDQLIDELSAALSEIKALRGILPLCSYCKKVRDDRGYWEQVDVYISQHYDADVSHSICPECVAKHYPEEHEELQKMKKGGAAERSEAGG